MNTRISFILILLSTMLSCSMENHYDTKIIFLHHSTGHVLWEGGRNNSVILKATRRISEKLGKLFERKPELQSLFEQYNKKNGTYYGIDEKTFPAANPYGWNNYPFDYYNIWVKNAGVNTFMEEPTLEILTKDYEVIILKHCFPVSNILAETDSADIDSELKTISNYKLQYLSLRDKFNDFPDTKFIVFTGAIQVKSQISEEQAKRALEFFNWVTNEWDQAEDNVYIWDLYSLQTEGGLFFKEEYARSPTDSHPNMKFAKRAVELLFNRIIDVIEHDGSNTSVQGIKK